MKNNKSKLGLSMDAKEKNFRDYNARLYWPLTNRCNLNCVYCITVCPDKKTAPTPSIDIFPLMATLEKANKVFNISFTGGGEPFLVPNLVEACIEITKKHYVSFDTNLTSTQIKRFAETVPPDRVTRILASAHIKELERRKLLITYINHFLLLKEKGFDIGAKAVAYPPLFREVEKYRQFFKENNIELEFVSFFGNYGGKEYPFSYTRDELEVFGLSQLNDIKELGLGQPHRVRYRHQKICNAGYNIGEIVGGGDIYICNYIKSGIGHIYEGIKFRKSVIICPFKSFCRCAFYRMDAYLFERARKECKSGPEKFSFYRLCLALVYEKIDKILGRLGIFLKGRYPRLYFYCKNFQNKREPFKWKI